MADKMEVPVQPADNTSVQEPQNVQTIEKTRQSKEDMVDALSSGKSERSKKRIEDNVSEVDKRLKQYIDNMPEPYKTMYLKEASLPENKELGFNDIVFKALHRNGYDFENATDVFGIGGHPSRFINRKTGDVINNHTGVWPFWGQVVDDLFDRGEGWEEEYKRVVGSQWPTGSRRKYNLTDRVEESMQQLKDAADPRKYETESFLQEMVNRFKPTGDIRNGVNPGPDAFDAEGGRDRTDNKTADYLQNVVDKQR